MSCRMHDFKDITETDVPNMYIFPLFHMLIQTMTGATYCLNISLPVQ
jgi:hypothetical protein